MRIDEVFPAKKLGIRQFDTPLSHLRAFPSPPRTQYTSLIPLFPQENNFRNVRTRGGRGRKGGRRSKLACQAVDATEGKFASRERFTFKTTVHEYTNLFAMRQ